MFMSNVIVSAAAEGVSKASRSRIMQLAWAIYRKQWNGSRPASEASHRKAFSRSLKSAWVTVKWETAQALKTVNSARPIECTS